MVSNFCTCHRLAPMNSRIHHLLTALLACIVLLPMAAADAEDHADIGILIRTPLLEKMVREQRRHSEVINKSILGSQVGGQQSTVTDVRLRVVPDSQRIRLEIVNTGRVQSMTQNVHAQAYVESSGQHAFEIIKPVLFDGRTLLTERGYGTVCANESPVRVFSNYSRMPVFGGIADQIAYQEVRNRKDAIDRAVAEDLVRDVIPKVDAETDRELAVLSSRIRQLQIETGSRLGLREDVWSAASAADGIRLWASADSVSVTGTTASGQNTPPGMLTETNGNEDVVMLVSDTLASRVLNRMLPGGLTLTDTQLNTLISVMNKSGEPLSPALVRSALSSPGSADAEAALFSLQLAETDPFQLSFSEGQIRLRTTFQVLPRIGPSSGMHITETVFRGTPLPGDLWMLSSHVASTRPVADGHPPALVIDDVQESQPGVQTHTTGSVWTQLIQTTSEKLIGTLPGVELQRTLDLKASDPRMPRLRLDRIQSRHGMLRISLRQLNTP